MQGARSSYTEKERNDFIERHFTRAVTACHDQCLGTERFLN